MVLSSELSLRVPDGTLHDFVFDAFRQYGQSTAFVNHGTKEKLSFADVEAQSRFIAHGLVCMGVEKGEVVTVCVENQPEAICILLGASLAGTVVSFISCVSTKNEVVFQLERTHSRFAFVIPSTIGLLREAFEKVGKDFRLISVGSREDSGDVPILCDLRLSMAPSPSFPSIEPAEDVVYLPFSSGMHGDKKPILITHSVFITQLAVANHPSYDNARHGEHTVTFLTYSRHFGLESTLVALVNGATVVTVPASRPNIALGLELLREYEMRVVCGTPYFVHLLSHEDVSLPALRLVLVGTASVTRRLHETFVHRFPQTRIVSIYGMTETGMLCRSTPRLEYSKAVGSLAPSLQLKVLDLLSGEELGVKEKGMIYVAGPSTSAPYLEHPESNPIGGWRKTGDIGYFDEENQIHLIDHAKDMIKVFGYQVIPREIEDILHSHPSVMECAVIGVADAESGQRPIAYVVLKQMQKVTAEELKEYVNKRLIHKAKLLTRVEIAQTIPRTPCGAVLRRVLSEAANLSLGNMGRSQ